jgi:hypothetical protein
LFFYSSPLSRNFKKKKKKNYLHRRFFKKWKHEMVPEPDLSPGFIRFFSKRTEDLSGRTGWQATNQNEVKNLDQ